jgi:hypothetical protein
MYNDIRNILCAADPFFRDGYDGTKRKKISMDAKLMIAIKVFAYGSCANSFHDYYQRLALKIFRKHFYAPCLHLLQSRWKLYIMNSMMLEEFLVPLTAVMCNG